MCCANEHDSVCLEGDSANCPEPIHTVIRLAKRDDILARQIAEQNGMVVKVCLVANFFLLFLFLICLFCQKNPLLRGNRSLALIIFWNTQRKEQEGTREL